MKIIIIIISNVLFLQEKYPLTNSILNARMSYVYQECNELLLLIAKKIYETEIYHLKLMSP